MDGVAAFWLFLAVVYACDTWLYAKGHETLFHKHKTEAEKKLRDAAVSKATKGVE